MSTHPALPPARSSIGDRGAPLSTLPGAPSPHDRAFVALQDAYRNCGGIGCGESMARRMSLTDSGGYVHLARCIVDGQLFSFRWHEQIWLPLFQFDPVRLTPRDASRRVLHELHGALDGWAIAGWFVAPNARLAGERPVDLLATDLPSVLAAAGAARRLSMRSTPPT